MIRRVLTATASLALLVGGLSAHAVPPATVGVIASSNVDWVASIPDIAPTGARFLGDTLYVTTVDGLRIYTVGADGIPVPKGALALPHYENEDVDTNGKTLLVAADHGLGIPNVLYVIDVSNAMLPTPLKAITVDAAHTASCINNCTYAWLGGASSGVYVVDLRDPANAKEVGSFQLPVRGLAHDVQVDAAGIAWVSAGSGLFGYSTADPLHPVLVASDPNGSAGAFHNNFIIHNSMRPNATAWRSRTTDDGTVRPGELVLVTEENWLPADNGQCSNDGRFQTGRYVKVGGVTQLTKLDDFHVGRGTVGDLTTKPAAVVSCSAHYFDYRADGVVAVAWYEQGIRFLDVSDPRDIRQIGYYMPALGESFAEYFHGGFLYTLDTYRGIEVLRFNGTAGQPAQLAPALNPTTLARPSAQWGYACRLHA